ncbi:MAG: AraC family transcriptional regulator [Lentisphaerota bacterium]
MKDKNIPLLWVLSHPPAGASLWLKMAGALTGYGESHYHLHPDYFCPHVITKGSGTVIANGEKMIVSRGDMFTLWPGVEIEYYENPDDNWKFFYLHLFGESCLEYMKSCGFSKDKLSLKPLHPEKAISLFSQIYSLHLKQIPGQEYRVLSMLYNLPETCPPNQVKNMSKTKNIFAKAVTVIDSQISSAINVCQLCDILKISRITLFRIFSSEAGCSPIEYITRARIRKAEQLLKNSDLNIANIAQISGFASDKYFMKRFRKIKGITPNTFRLKS